VSAADRPYLRVQTGNGVKAFDTSASGIPDSAIYRWKFSAGSGSTATDSIGSADGTINGATWVSGTYVDGEALSGDGTDDYVNVGQLPDFSSITGGNFAIAYTVDDFTSGTGNFGLNTTDGGEAVQVRHGNTGPSGAPELYLQDSSDGSTLFEYATSGPLDDGNKHRVIVNKNGNTAGDIEFYDNTTQLSTTNITDGGFSSTGSFTNDFFLLGASQDGSLDSPMGATLDDIIIFSDSLISQQIQDDYDRQPWS